MRIWLLEKLFDLAMNKHTALLLSTRDASRGPRDLSERQRLVRVGKWASNEIDNEHRVREIYDV